MGLAARSAWLRGFFSSVACATAIAQQALRLRPRAACRTERNTTRGTDSLSVLRLPRSPTWPDDFVPPLVVGRGQRFASPPDVRPRRSSSRPGRPRGRRVPTSRRSARPPRAAASLSAAKCRASSRDKHRPRLARAALQPSTSSTSELLRIAFFRQSLGQLLNRQALSADHQAAVLVDRGRDSRRSPAAGFTRGSNAELVRSDVACPALSCRSRDSICRGESSSWQTSRGSRRLPFGQRPPCVKRMRSGQSACGSARAAGRGCGRRLVPARRPRASHRRSGRASGRCRCARRADRNRPG